ncbi:pilus assembly protein CpaB [Enterobacter sp. DRP3]|nr:pilus assembly protein CpaB [Enterobacter sp. DRP3]
MNHRMLFFLSVIVIAVGIIGIVTQKNAVVPHQSSITQIKTTKKAIVIAEATRELHPRDILRPEDFRIRTIEVDKNENDIRDLSSLGTKNLTGYLIRNNIPQDSSILPAFIEAPTSKTFVIHSLNADELPYGYPVSAEDGYLLSSLSTGDSVSMYIRLVEVEKDKESKVGLVSEGSNSSDKNMKKYALSRLTGPLSILQVNEDKKAASGHAYGQPIGTIVLRLNRKQLADLRVVEKAGDILLFPASNGQSDVKVRLDDVLPQFRSVKELRGGK